MATRGSGTLQPNRDRESPPHTAETPEQAGCTQGFVFKLLRYRDVTRILDAARQKPLSHATSKENGLDSLKKQHQQAGAKYGMLYPAILGVDMHSAGTKSFNGDSLLIPEEQCGVQYPAQGHFDMQLSPAQSRDLNQCPSDH